MQLRATVSGRVQGVGFRYNTRTYAKGLGLVGWVKNDADGNVEVCAQGSKDALETLLEWLHHGPSYSWVEGVEHVWVEDDEKFAAFDLRL